MPRLNKTCSVPGCPEVVAVGRCAEHQRAADLARGTAGQRGYTGRPHHRFRRAVLRRDLFCTWPDGCDQLSTDADHHPLSRRDLVASGANPNDPAHGRGLCGLHHKQATAQHQPGGWHAR
jgi:5-methylcytosine-specific restriction protein A